MLGIGIGVNRLTGLLNVIPLPNTITITGEPDAGTLTTATAGQTHAELLALIDEGTATTDGPGSVTITATLLGDSTDPVEAGQSITGVNLLYTATEAPSVPRTVTIDPAITVAAAPVPANLAFTVSGPQPSAGADVPYTVTSDKNTTAEAIIYLAGGSAPGLSDFDTGATTGFIDLGPITITTGTNNVPLALPDGLNGSYVIALLPADGALGDIAVSDAVTIDTVVSNPWLITDAPNLEWSADYTDAAKFTDDGTNLSIALDGTLARTITSTGKTGISIGTDSGVNTYQRTGDAVFRDVTFPAKIGVTAIMGFWVHSPADTAITAVFSVEGLSSGGGTRYRAENGRALLFGDVFTAVAPVINTPIIEILSMRFDGADYQLEYRRNGTIVQTITRPNTGDIASSLGLGHYPTSGTSQSYRGHMFGCGSVAEFNQDTLDRIEGYWADKLGITLRAGHPYENSPPEAI